jgi:hypothetical protein
MKKILAILLSTALMLSLVTTVVFGETVTIGHSVDVLDSFSVKSKNITKFTGTTAVEIAEVAVINNTRDGYKVELSTTNGALHSATADNGEDDIPYVLSKSQSGSQPAGVVGAFTALTVPTEPPTDATLILGNEQALTGAANLLNDATDLEFTLKVAISDSSFLAMAGTYSDTITVTYSDL